MSVGIELYLGMILNFANNFRILGSGTKKTGKGIGTSLQSRLETPRNLQEKLIRLASSKKLYVRFPHLGQ